MIGGLIRQLLDSPALFTGRLERSATGHRTRQLLLLAVALAFVLLVVAGCEIYEY